MTSLKRLALASVLLAACATPPKPREMEAFEKLKTDPNAEVAMKRSPNLVGEADRFYALAKQEWESNDQEESRRDALMALIKMKTALALVEQDQSKARIAQAAADQAKAEDEYGRVSKDLTATNEQVALLQKLGSASAERQKLSQALTDEQQRAAANDKLSAAELALKTADTVNASNYAKVEYTAASDLFTRAQTEFKSNNFPAAVTSAELAKQKAEQAAMVAKPAYEADAQNKSNKERDEALGKDASGLPGVTVRLERRGDLQRLVLPLSNLFVRKATTLAPGRESVIDAVAALLKKYPTYPIQVIGHTDKRGRHDELVAISMARAQSVQNALLSRGVESKRMVVSGMGPDEPVSDNRTTTGRAQNNRVEIVFLYQ